MPEPLLFSSLSGLPMLVHQGFSTVRSLNSQPLRSQDQGVIAVELKIHPVRFKHLRFSFVRNVVHSTNFKLRLNGKFRTRRITPHHASKTFNQATSQETEPTVPAFSQKRTPGQLSHKGEIHPQQCHCPPQRHSRDGGNPAKVTVDGETVSRNGKERGR